MQFTFQRVDRGIAGELAKDDPAFRRACATALTNSVRIARDRIRDQLPGIFDRPTYFTQRGFYTLAATPANLRATLGVMDKQAEYLQYQIEGGSRSSPAGLKLPSAISLDGYGNIPRGLIRALITRAKSGKRATPGQARRFSIKTSDVLVYGDPGNGMPRGIYRRDATAHKLIPVIVFPRAKAHYRRRFDFHGMAEREVDRVFPDQLERALRGGGLLP